MDSAIITIETVFPFVSIYIQITNLSTLQMSICTEARSCDVLKQTLSLGLKGQCSWYLFLPWEYITLSLGRTFSLGTEITIEDCNQKKSGPHPELNKTIEKNFV